MKTNNQSKWRGAVGIFMGIGSLLLLLVLAVPSQSANQSFLYLPFVAKPVLPPPTPTPAPVPQFFMNIALPNAQCPSQIAAHPVTGYVYVANNGNGTTSILNQTDYIVTAETGGWTSHVAVDPDSTRAFISSMHGDPGGDGYVSVFDHATFITKMPGYLEPFVLAYHPTKKYVYASDPHLSVVSVYDAQTFELIEHVQMEAGWVKGVAVDLATGLVYVSNWEYGRIYVLDGTEIVNIIHAGWGPEHLAIDHIRGYVYVGHTAPNEDHPQNISVIKDGVVVASFYTGSYVGGLDVDLNTGLVYVSNTSEDRVTVINGTQHVTEIPVGAGPMGIAVNQQTGYVFVANSRSDTVSVIKDAQVVATYETGKQPFRIAIDEVRNTTYIANRNSIRLCDDLGQCQTICDPASLTVLR